MRNFTATTTRKREIKPSGTFVYRFPSWPWFMLTLTFWVAWRARDRYPRHAPETRSETRIKLNDAGRGIVSMTFDDPMYVRQVIRK